MTAEQPELPRRPGPEQELISSPMDLESEEKEGEVGEGKEEEKIELEDGGVTFTRPTIVPSGMSMEFMVSVFRTALLVGWFLTVAVTGGFSMCFEENGGRASAMDGFHGPTTGAARGTEKDAP